MAEPSANTAGQGARRRPALLLLILALCAGLACAGFIALGTWQVKRLQWKLALIDKVEHRVHAAPVAAPAPERWPQVSAANDEYRRVRLAGAYLHEFTAKVQATTELGGGFWLLTPLCGADGNITLVNRGFVPSGAGDRPTSAPASTGVPAQACAPGTVAARGEVGVTGLLRISEPGGGFLRDNDPAGERWYSRDVAAIAAARGLPRVAPYFVDADAGSAAQASAGAGAQRPVGGLTVIAFQNNHLVYALTWYALALMLAAACAWVVRTERNRRSA